MEFLHNNKDLFSQAISLVFSKNNIRPEIVEKSPGFVTCMPVSTSRRKCFGTYKKDCFRSCIS